MCVGVCVCVYRNAVSRFTNHYFVWFIVSLCCQYAKQHSKWEVIVNRIFWVFFWSVLPHYVSPHWLGYVLESYVVCRLPTEVRDVSFLSSTRAWCQIHPTSRAISTERSSPWGKFFRRGRTWSVTESNVLIANRTNWMSESLELLEADTHVDRGLVGRRVMPAGAVSVNHDIRIVSA